MSHFEREINEQPDALERLLRSGAAREAAVALQADPPALIATVARGSSNNAVAFFSHLAGRYLRLPVANLPLSLFSVYGSTLELPATLAVAVSQSGRSEDVLRSQEALGRAGARTVAVTNDPDSPMAQLADHHLPLGVGPEKAVAASKTLTAQMLALARLVAAWSEDAALEAALQEVPARLRELLDDSAELRHAALRLTHAPHAYILGRGLSEAAALEAALKLKETTYMASQGYSSAEFQHGPLASVTANTPVLLLACSDETLGPNLQAANRLRDTGADLTIVAADPELLRFATTPVTLPAGLHPATEAFLMVALGQLLSLEVARARGFDPDQPRHLSKVTHTI